MGDQAAVEAPQAYGPKLCRGLGAELFEPGILRVTFDSPERMNATTQAMKRELIELLARVQMDDAVRVVVFAGAGKNFVAGDDLAGYHDDAPAMVPKIGAGHATAIGTTNALKVYSQALNAAIRGLDKLTIAAVNGYAIQSGLSIALSCDFRIGSQTARLGSATLRYGFLPDEGGHFLLVQHLGLARTLDFLMRKKIVGADEALALGLLNEVVAPEALMPRAMELARELADGPQVAMRLLKRAVYNAAESNFAQAMDDIAVRTAITDHHPDAKEGGLSFREKRPPRFNRWLDGEGGGH